MHILRLANAHRNTHTFSQEQMGSNFILGTMCRKCSVKKLTFEVQLVIPFHSNFHLKYGIENQIKHSKTYIFLN